MTVRSCSIFFSIVISVIFNFGSLCFGEIKLPVDRDKILQGAIDVTSEMYPNADEVQLEDYTLVQYNGDGSDWMVNERYVKILTEKGKRANQNLTNSFTIPYDEIEVRAVEVIKPDGSSIEIDVEAQSRVMVDRSQMSSNIYNPNSKVMVTGVAGIEVGDILHTVIEKRLIKTRMPNSWSDWQIFEYYNPIKHTVYEVHAPVEMPLNQIALKGEIENTVKFSEEKRNVVLNAGGSEERIVYKWEVNDVPRFYAEDDMPTFYTVVQRLLVSTNPDWETVSKWYWELVEPHLKANEEMKSKVAELTEGLESDQERIEAIFKFVSQDIRYLGITVEENAPGYEPHDAKMTFDNRHGVCRDKAALLVALLRVAGFEAFPVLIYSGPKKDPEVPQPFFNHAISAVRRDDGTFLLMDSTDESTKELLPAYLNDCSYLVATPEGEALHVSPIIPCEENMMYIKTIAAIDSAGNYSAKSSLNFEGINDNAYRGYFSRISEEERKSFFEGIVKKIVPGATLESFALYPSDMLDTSEKVRAEIEYQAENISVGENGKTLVPIPMVGSKVGIVNFVLGKTGLKERRFPLETNFACGVREELSIDVDDKYGKILSVPEFENIENDLISWQRKLERENNTIKGESEFQIKVVRFEPSEYLELKNNLKQIEYNNRKMCIFNMGYLFDRDNSDSIVKLEEITYEIISENKWKKNAKIRKEILSYKGKKDNSELKFTFNPEWDEFKLISAKVINNGEEKFISEKEKNLMDAAWVGSAPRYPAEKTLVASLPGVEVGSIIEYEYEFVLKDRPFFEMQEYFKGYDPVDKKIVTIIYPKKLEKKLKLAFDNNGLLSEDFEVNYNFFISKIKEDETITCTWTAINQKAVKKEASVSPALSFVPFVMASTGEWREYGKIISKKLNSAAIADSSVRSKAKELAGDLGLSTKEKIIAIRDFVDKNIRFVPVGLGSLPYESITKASKTLEDGYGNSVDKAVLIYSMLKSVGVGCEFEMVSSYSGIEELSSPDFADFRLGYPDKDIFTKVLVRANDFGKTIYLNDTSQYAEAGTTASENKLAYNLRSNKINKIMPEAQLQSNTNAVIRIVLENEQNATIEYEGEYFGSMFEVKNKYYSEIRPEEKSRYYQELITQLSQSAESLSELETDFSNYPGKINYKVKAENYSVRDGKYMYVLLPGVIENLITLRSDERETPYYHEADLKINYEIAVEMPSEYSKIILKPDDQVKEFPSGESRISVKSDIEEGKIILHYDIELNPMIIEPVEYEKLLEIVSWANHKSNRTIMFESD